ncbi:hypothetical protein Pse7429DRAFT_4735, partial [Pseudanabaena biceps PCC 7429]
RHDEIGSYFGNRDRYHFLGDEFGIAAQAACFFLFFFAYVLLATLGSSFWETTLYI